MLRLRPYTTQSTFSSLIYDRPRALSAGMLITHMMDVAPDALASADGGADAAPPELSDLVSLLH